jgi:hypothetical protein
MRKVKNYTTEMQRSGYIKAMRSGA